jgi:guanylate kinase
MSSPVRSRSPRPRLAADDAARLQVRTEVLAQEHSAYIARHPELVQLLQDLMASALLHKPEDSFEFARKYLCDVQGKYHVSQEEAAVKIQSISRMKRDKARVKGIKQSKDHVEPPPVVAPKVQRVPLVVAGAPCTGKSAVLARVRAKYPHLLAHAPAHTSREPLPNEDDGKDFFFVDDAQMQQMLEAGAFAVSWTSGGQRYGVHRALILDILKTNRVPLLELSARNLTQLKHNLAPAKVMSLYFMPPPPAELEQRLLKSGARSREQVQSALEEAEADQALQLESVCDHIQPSGRLEDCFLQVEKLALVAAGAKTVENFTAEDEKRIVLMQTIARGKRDKKRVDSIRQQRRVRLFLPVLRMPLLTRPLLCRRRWMWLSRAQTRFQQRRTPRRRQQPAARISCSTRVQCLAAGAWPALFCEPVHCAFRLSASFGH